MLALLLFSSPANAIAFGGSVLLGPAITLTGDVKADMDKVRAFYAEKRPVAFDPSKFGPIRLREEEPAPAGDGPAGATSR